MNEFNDILTTVGGMVTIVGFFCVCINYGVIRPLEKSIDALAENIKDLSVKIASNDERLDKMNERLTRVETRLDTNVTDNN